MVAAVAMQQIEDGWLELPRGPLRVRRHLGDGRLAIGVPGLSANAFSFEALGQGRSLAALDLRGRGRSAAGKRGMHGWENHAADVLAVADALGVERFDYVGHSMGAFIGLLLANRAPERIRRLVLIDAAGVPDPRAMPPIFGAVQRLGTVYPSADVFLARVRDAGVVPWGPFWEAHYREDLIDVPGGVAQRASSAAVLEDLAFASTVAVRDLWPGVGMQTLLVRAAVPLAPGGDVVTEADRDAFLRAAPRAQAVEVPANHYGVMHHPKTARAVKEFLS